MFSISLPIYLPWKLVGVDIGKTFWRATLQLLMPSLKNVRTLPPFGICRKYQPDGAERRRYKGVITELLVTASLVDQLQKRPQCPILPCILFQSHFAALSSKRWNWFLNPLNLDWPLTRCGQWNMEEVTMCQFQVLASGALVCSHLFSWTSATNMRTSLA